MGGMIAMKRTNTAERGFTLIELSIVLVIIGLLVGGILKGQELIASTELKTQVAQVDGTRAAVNTFEDKYGSLPGDLTNVNFLPGSDGSTYKAPSSDGLIGSGGSNGGSSQALRSDFSKDDEVSGALEHLRLAGLITGIQAGNPNYLPAKVSGAGVILAAMNTDGAAANYIRVAGGNGYGNNGALRATDAYELDRKYDDGVPTSGDMWAIGTGQSACVQGAGLSKYNPNSEGVNCIVAFTLR